jgi:hypothetical protein
MMSSLVIFSIDVGRLATFYEAILEVRPTVEPSGDIRLVGGGEEVLIHSIPQAIARNIEISSPPKARDGFPMKPVFNVDSLGEVLEVVEANGGVLTDNRFTFDGLTRHDVLDPDGNVVQLRGRMA